ncbi:histidine kinase N-terminal 7TM domain-containing protein [Roseicyclus marinus]|uniref:histidine kinase N-terminal 7TM domain-containing protein n=1 Tax=Roseicyclus marinus TaxID=2161673 RepID=UPI00240EF562|nr:histidine kinase N-terminal 7TM domain-containing protein [Roseicyclus marinus]MDG3039778.1 histidine kinase N-terminal 7TM domain-containing protein [Roseicyclus marinus]
MTGCFQDILLDLPVYTSATTALGLVVLATWILRHEDFVGRRYFVATVIGMMIWVVMATVEMMVQGLGCKMAAATATWPAIALVPVAWSFFIWHFCFNGMTRWQWAEVFAIGLIVTGISAAAFTNPYHGLLYGAGTALVTETGRPFVRFDHGPLFYGIAAFLYGFMIVSLVVSATGAFRASRTLRPLMFLLMCATLVPMVSNISYLFFDGDIAGFDPTPFAFSFVLLVLTWAIYAARGLDLVSVARDLLYFNTNDPVLVVNAGGVVVGANAASLRLMPELGKHYRLSAEGPFAPIAEVLTDTGPHTRQTDISVLGRLFNLRVLPIPRPLSETGAHLGAVAIMTDMTALETQNAQLKAALEQSRLQLGEISRLREIAETTAMSDPLTKIGNRRALEMRADAVGPGAFSVALIDLDNFKAINDKLGHTVGDRVLKNFAALVRDTLPPNADVFRVGGEEFVVMAVGMSMADFVGLIDTMRSRLGEAVALRERDEALVTFSAGVAGAPEDGTTLEALYACADARLYKAKVGGRDRVVSEGNLSAIREGRRFSGP